MAKTAAKNTPVSTAPRAPRKGKKSADAVVMNHAEMLEADNIDNLLAELTGMGGEPEIVLEAGAANDTDATPIVIADAAPAVALSDDELEATLGRVEAVQASIDAASPAVTDPAAMPTGDASDAVPLTPADALADAPAAPKIPRKHYANKVDRIKDRLGAGAADYTVLTLADAGVSDEDLKNVMDSTFAIIQGMNKKEQNRASLLFDFLSGKKATLNTVLEKTLRVLHRDGHITTGKDSNLITELLGKPYSIGSARAMSGNTVGMYADLKLLKADGKGRFVANAESTLLAAANAKLGLVTA
ncbi:hypothetical protein GFK26_18255 [Variovorax paradoxus]|uniref:Uncharacterized protein n=1 Tax=Variovorax paradoxus TaxID=34073 RepID=A0A5Q0M4L9_VARPD|nr:hypothetical protein [Variovorax paradoxus]QFZ84571.1 hypothetical protein GFK26_18255 [Variovorax paradoxus]